MEQITNSVKSIIGNLKGILIASAGLLIIVQIVFGASGFDVVGNLTALIDGFIGCWCFFGISDCRYYCTRFIIGLI